jgi:hypothetical protein
MVFQAQLHSIHGYGRWEPAAGELFTEASAYWFRTSRNPVFRFIHIGQFNSSPYYSDLFGDAK